MGGGNGGSALLGVAVEVQCSVWLLCPSVPQSEGSIVAQRGLKQDGVLLLLFFWARAFFLGGRGRLAASEPPGEAQALGQEPLAEMPTHSDTTPPAQPPLKRLRVMDSSSGRRSSRSCPPLSPTATLVVEGDTALAETQSPSVSGPGDAAAGRRRGKKALAPPHLVGRQGGGALGRPRRGRSRGPA